jgi:hypothetical protein
MGVFSSYNPIIGGKWLWLKEAWDSQGGKYFTGGERGVVPS